MAMNFVQLDATLSTIVERMTPPAVKASTTDLYKHFMMRHEEAYARMTALKERTDGIHLRATLAAVGASVGALGMLATTTAPVMVPVAGAVGLGTAAVVAARVLVHHARTYFAEEEAGKMRRLLEDGGEGKLALAYERDLGGGPLTRLYRRTKDLFIGHDMRAATLISRIEQSGVSGAAHQEHVRRVLREALTPAFVEYVQRNARAPYTEASRLMARLRELPDMDLLAFATPRATWAAGLPRLGATPVKPGISAGAGMPALGRTLVGLAPTRGAPSLLADLGLTTERKAPTPVTHYGYIAASESDRNFLQSLGIDLGTYDDMQGAFPARVDAQALPQLNEYREEFHADLHALPDGRVDARTLLLDTPVGTADAATLSGYRAFLRYTVGTEVGGRRAGDVLSDVNREVHRRNAAQRQLEQPARTAGATALEM